MRSWHQPPRWRVVEGREGFKKSMTNRYMRTFQGCKDFPLPDGNIKTSPIILQKFQYSSKIIFQNCVKIYEYNRSCKFVHIYCHHIDIYRCNIFYISNWYRYITDGVGRGKNWLIYRYEGLTKVFFTVTYLLNGPLVCVRDIWHFSWRPKFVALFR